MDPHQHPSQHSALAGVGDNAVPGSPRWFLGKARGAREPPWCVWA